MELKEEIEAEMATLIRTNAKEITRESRADNFVLSSNVIRYSVLGKVMTKAGHDTPLYIIALSRHLDQS